MKERTIPLVDLRKYDHSDEKQAFVKKLGDAFHSVGFVGVVNHGISERLVDNFYAAAKRFFNRPDALKKKYEKEELHGQRGYTSFGKERAKGSNVADLKEFFQIGQDLEADDPLSKEYPDNVHVEEVPEFTALGIELYRAFEKAGTKLLRAIALHLGLDEQYFDRYIEKGNSILRAIHYPPITEEPESAIRAEEHEDINLITLLVGASAGGLQLLNKKGEWVPIEPEENEIVVNVGDMLQRLTNDYLRSTTHRVVNPPREEWDKPRLSIPFFLHPRSEMDLSCLDNCVTENRPLKYEPITAGEYLNERLKEIGLKK